jgi:putative transposase
MTFQPELLDELLKGYQKPEDLMGEGGILKQLTKALVERCLSAEMDTHLEEQRTQIQPEQPSVRNRRNGHSKKTIKGEFGEAEIVVPRERTSEFEPILVKKGQTRFDGFDDKILALYARGMTTRDIQVIGTPAFQAGACDDRLPRRNCRNYTVSKCQRA